MLDYSDFYDLAVYGNENWKGSFTPKEIACNADCYYSDFKWSLERKKMAESMYRRNRMMEITREQAGTTLVISLHGKLDTAAAPAVEAEIRKGLSGVKKLCWN